LRKTTIFFISVMEHSGPAGRMLVFHQVKITEPLAWASKDKRNMKNTLFSDMTPHRLVGVY
jgi:hypothetical protein